MATAVEVHKHKCTVGVCGEQLECSLDVGCPRGWLCQYHQPKATGEAACPWCYGGGWYLSAAIGRDKYVECGYCKGTGRAELWTAHTDYARTQAIKSGALRLATPTADPPTRPRKSATR